MGSLHRLKLPPRLAAPVSEREVDLGLGALLGLLWLASAYRVVVAAAEHEVFRAEASLAFVCLFAIPWLAVRACRTRKERRAERQSIVEMSAWRRHAAELRRRL